MKKVTKISYTITVGPMRESQMRPILAALKETNLKYDLNADVEVEDIEAKPNGKATASSIICLTGKKPTAGSNREKITTVLEKLEVKHGIGTVNRKLLRETCEEQGIDSQIIYQLIRDGYMKVMA